VSYSAFRDKGFTFAFSQLSIGYAYMKVAGTQVSSLYYQQYAQVASKNIAEARSVFEKEKDHYWIPLIVKAGFQEFARRFWTGKGLPHFLNVRCGRRGCCIYNHISHQVYLVPLAAHLFDRRPAENRKTQSLACNTPVACLCRTANSVHACTHFAFA
jgi:hypothetical protein